MLRFPKRFAPALVGMALLLTVIHGRAGNLESGAVDAVSLDKDWHLWLDTAASWKDDMLYLPDEVNLAKLPINPPTGGWQALDGREGDAIPTLPATVEQYHWGQPPCKVANPAKPDDVVTLNGSYQGVSWWYRTFTAPALKTGEHLVLSFPGARMRAEVYVNGQLVGYNLITESAFTADATAALKPGQPNVLAVRITNPGGNFSWGDFELIKWGQYGIPVSHGFGGLDGGVTMAVRAPVSVSDVVVFNQPDPHAISVSIDVTSTGPAADKPVAVSLRRVDREVWKGTVQAHVPANGTVTVTQAIALPNADLWDIGHPSLYTADARLAGDDDRSAWDTVFGFRWFTAEGIGTDAKLYLNGRRVVVKSSISWGFWSPNGMFPDRTAADREVAAVQALGLNAIQTHRHMPKPVVLDAFDQAGLLRYCEPGAGTFTLRNTPDGGVPHGSGPVDTSGKGGGPTTWFNRYELAKVLAMVRANRSHPSVIIWSLQNELDPSDLHNPKVFYTLRKIHGLDPSRIVMLKSGGGPANQAWALPYSDEFRHDDGKGYSGWWDQHTADNCPGIPEIPTTSVSVYQDGMYKSPQDFSYRVTNEREIMTWGELAIGASADDQSEIVKWYQDNHLASGYDLASHATLAAAYDQALDQYGFRDAYPKSETLFRQIAAKQYFNAARLTENVRISDPNDYLVLSGWESTAIENHSGMVDALRQLKGDPAPIKEAMAPALLVVRPRHLVMDKGEAVTVDVHLVNEVNLHGAFTLAVSASQGGGKPFFSQSYPVNATGGEKFGELLKEGITFTPPQPGMVTVSAALSAANAAPVLRREAPVLVVDARPAPIRKTVAYVGEAEPIVGALKERLGVTAVPLAAATAQVDDIIVDTNLWRYEKADHFQKADDPNLYKEQYSHPAGPIVEYRNLAPGALKVELFFAEGQWEKPGQRVFDVALNDRTVLEKFDIVGESGGRGLPVVKPFDVDSLDGTLKVSVPRVEADRALFAAIRVTDSKGKVITQAFRPKDYNDDKRGIKWKAADLAGFDWKPVLSAVLERVRAGSRLVILTSGHQDAGQAAATLAGEKLLTYNGMVGQSNAAWLGFWYFGRKHWLLDGLPADGVLDWPYQITSGDGSVISAPGLESVVGYGMHHSARVGLGAAVLPVGKGQIVLLGLQNLEETFVAGTDHACHHVTAQRILYNALH